MKVSIPLSKANRLINHGPAVLVTSHSGGKQGVMTAAWQTPVSHHPPLVAISIAPERYTHHLIEESREFVINVPAQDLLQKVHGCGTVSGRKVNKFGRFGLTPIAGATVQAPLIEECIGHLECTLVASHTVGDHTLFVGEVLSASVEADLFDDFWKVGNPRAKTLHHLGSDKYTCPHGQIEPQ